MRRFKPMVAALFMMSPFAVNAASVTVDFTVSPTEGPLTGAVSSGYFSFDDSIIPSGGGLVSEVGLIDELSFVWNGRAYDETTANTGALIFDSSGNLVRFVVGSNCVAGECLVNSAKIDWYIVTASSDRFTYGDGNAIYRGEFDWSIRVVDSCAMTAFEFSDSVDVQPAGPTMLATFLPTNGCTLDEVAVDMGYDHFNWVQVITHYDGLLFAPGGIPINFFTPFLDPPDGGYISPWHPADSLPYYWDEVYGWPLDPAYHVDNQRPFPTILNFLDTPRSATINEPGEHMAFTTSLVGVVGGSVWVPEFTFKWKSNYNGQSGGTGTVRDISPPEGGEGGIFDVQILENPVNVPSQVQELWADNGGFHNIPVEIHIDVKPDSEKNCLNIDGNGVIPVTIFGSLSFDVTLIDLASLAFGSFQTRTSGNGAPLCATEDLNEDGITDLSCKFQDEGDQWVAYDDKVILRGKFFDGTGFFGTDNICMVPNN
jgi:hypothetical protein